MGLARMGVSSSAIAKELGCASRTVRSIIARAREQGELVRLPDRDILFVATRTETVGPREHMRNIIRETAGRAGVTVAEFTGSRRTASMTEIRRAAMARVYRECPELSLPEIGRGFGRDHTTILHHLREAGVYIPVKQKED
jgi:chromosomal replication initiation ATPase DnaA